MLEGAMCMKGKSTVDKKDAAYVCKKCGAAVKKKDKDKLCKPKKVKESGKK
jgi:rubrerythrin